MSREYDEDKKHKAASDMQKLAQLAADIRNLKGQLDSSRGREQANQIQHKINEKSIAREEIISTFHKEYHVETPRDLNNELIRQGVNFREYQREYQSEGEKQQSEQSSMGQGEQPIQQSEQNANDVMADQCKKLTPIMESGMQHLKNMEDASRTRDYEAFERESDQFLKHMQTASREIEYGKQRLREEMGNRDNNTNESHWRQPHELSSTQELLGRLDNMDDSRVAEKARSITVNKGEERTEAQSDSQDKGRNLTFSEKRENALREYHEAIEKSQQNQRDKDKGKTLDM